MLAVFNMHGLLLPRLLGPGAEQVAGTGRRGERGCGRLSGMSCALATVGLKVVEQGVAWALIRRFSLASVVFFHMHVEVLLVHAALHAREELSKAREQRDSLKKQVEELQKQLEARTLRAHSEAKLDRDKQRRAVFYRVGEACGGIQVVVM